MPGVAEIKPYGKDGYVAFTQLGVRQDFAGGRSLKISRPSYCGTLACPL